MRTVGWLTKKLCDIVDTEGAAGKNAPGAASQDSERGVDSETMALTVRPKTEAAFTPSGAPANDSGPDETLQDQKAGSLEDASRASSYAEAIGNTIRGLLARFTVSTLSSLPQIHLPINDDTKSPGECRVAAILGVFFTIFLI